MSIKSRLVMLVGVASLLAMVIGLVGWGGIAKSGSAITEINHVRLPSLIGLQTLSEAQTDIRLRTIETAIWELDYNATSFFADTLRKKEKAWLSAQKGWNIYAPLPQTAEEAVLWQRFEREWSEWKSVDTQLTEIMKKLAVAHSEEDQKKYFTQFYQLYAQQTELFNKSETTLEKIIEVNVEVAKDEADDAESASSVNNTVMIAITVVGILALIGFAVWLINIISSAIDQVVASVGRVAQTQQFDTRLASTQDEFNVLTQSLNHLFSGLNQAISEASQVVNAIANADFDQRMKGQYTGDLAILKQGVNASASSVSFMMSELEKVMTGLNTGLFDVRMDTKVPQAFRVLVETALNHLRHVVEDINKVMIQMSAGEFSGRVTAQASGELLTMKHNINASMDAMAQAIHSISDIVSAQAQGDLTRELSSTMFKGQLNELSEAINHSSARVKASVVQAVDASNIVSEAAIQVSQGSSDLSGRVQEQASALEQTSATMNEMAAAVQANTANAKKVAELAHQVQHQAGAGVSVMQQTIEAMQSIKESSSKIADIVSLIDGIAFQTNLLALNAAVEAARAGDHGRGFAVVAGEVRALAQKSAEAAKDIKELIHDSVMRIEVGTQLADKSGEMLSGITGSIEQVASMIEEIASASAEQSQGINQVHKAMADIDRVTQENAALVEETTSAATSLSTEANHLRENMSFFKTGVTSQARSQQHHMQHGQTPSRSSSKNSSTLGLPSPKSGISDWQNF